MEPRSRYRILAPSLDEDVACAAASHCPVLLYGAMSNTEWVARLIHDRSTRNLQPFTSFNLSGNGDDRRGLEALLRETTEGTFFVGHVENAGWAVQARLAAFVWAQPVFSPAVRVIAGSSVWLYDLVERGGFDARLFYRLNAISICVDQPRDGMVAVRRAICRNVPSSFSETGPGQPLLMA